MADNSETKEVKKESSVSKSEVKTESVKKLKVPKNVKFSVPANSTEQNKKKFKSLGPKITKAGLKAYQDASMYSEFSVDSVVAESVDSDYDSTAESERAPSLMQLPKSSMKLSMFKSEVRVSSFQKVDIPPLPETTDPSKEEDKEAEKKLNL